MDELELIRSKLATLTDEMAVLEGVFAFAPTAIQIYRPDGHPVINNPAFRHMFGAEPPPGYCVFQDEIAEANGLSDQIRRAFQGEVIRTPPIWYDPRTLSHVQVLEGKRVAMSALLFPIFDAARKVTHVVIAYRDETAAVEAEEDGRKREQRAKLLAKVSVGLAESLDPRMTLRNLIQDVIPELADWGTATLLSADGEQERVVVHHRDPAQAAECERYLNGFAPPRHRPGEAADLIGTRRRVFAPEVTEAQIEAFAQDDEHLRCLKALGLRSVIMIPMVTRGRTVGVISLLRGPGSPPFEAADLDFVEDLTRRTALAVDNGQLYEAERVARAEAERAVRMRDDFLSVAGHELRTPLTALKLHVDGIRRRMSRTAERTSPLTERISTLDRQVVRLTGLINALLDLSRISGGRLAIERAEVDLVPLVDEVVERTQEAHEADGGVVITVDAPRSVTGMWDLLRLEQVVTNLLTNAVKYGNGEPIAVRVSAQGDLARIDVTDQGIGIAPEDHERIFERFERAAPSRHYSGMGLGLWITRQLVQAMGGQIWVESRRGAGATFSVVLPRSGEATDVGSPRERGVA